MTEGVGVSKAVDLPASVAVAVRSARHSVLIDPEALAAVREQFTAAQADSLAGYLQESQAANTLRAYRTDWLAWLAWCSVEGRTALPADPLDVAVYLATAADTLAPEGAGKKWAFAPSTLDRKAAAIAAVHASNGQPVPTRADVVRLTMRGIRRVRTARARRVKPVDLSGLTALLAELPPMGWPSGVARLRDALALLMGFAGALRRSELAAITTEHVDVTEDASSGEPMLIVHLGVTKTDADGRHEQRVALPRGSRPHTCPVCAYASWTDLLAVYQCSGRDGVREWLGGFHLDLTVHRCHAFAGPVLSGPMPLFPRVDRHGNLGAQPMTGRAVAELVKRYAQRAGLDPAMFSGHSLRSGFATQAALGGASDREIMRQGRWTNPRTVHGYIRTANPLADNAVTRLGL